MAEKNEKAVPSEVVKTTEESPVLKITIQDFVLQLVAADILKAGFKRHAEINSPGLAKTPEEWQEDFDAFLNATA